MAFDQNKQSQQGNLSSETQREHKESRNGIITVNDEKNPTPEERDAQIPNEPDTERLRSERQSVQDGKRSE